MTIDVINLFVESGAQAALTGGISTSSLLNGDLILALILWLCLLTFLMLPLLILVLVQHCRQKNLEIDYQDNVDKLVRQLDDTPRGGYEAFDNTYSEDSMSVPSVSRA